MHSACRFIPHCVSIGKMPLVCNLHQKAVAAAASGTHRKRNPVKTFHSYNITDIRESYSLRADHPFITATDIEVLRLKGYEWINVLHYNNGNDDIELIDAL
ncbi:hypothetical protein KAR91_61955 [Candidatus Pacearchaeota archaeon]|nr:hypothetical protein [Candidatus Pacearchaeota archaeon]